MIGAALIFFGAVVLGALLRCVVPPPPPRVTGAEWRLLHDEWQDELYAMRRAPRKTLRVMKRPDGTREVVEAAPWEEVAGFALVLHRMAMQIGDELVLGQKK